MSQEVSHLGFLLPVSHVCLQIAFPLSHIGFTISLNFYNSNVKLIWGLVCGLIQLTLCMVWANIHFFPIDFNGELQLFLKHLKNNFFCLHMSHFSYACKMWYLLNLVLESWEYLWSYLTFWVVILDYGLKFHKLSIHTLVMLQKWLEIHKIIVWSLHCILFPAIFATKKIQKKFSTWSSKLNYWCPRHQIAASKAWISFKCS